VPGGTQDDDCYKWNNAPNILCYQCDSCKAGVMEQIRQDWLKVSVLMVVVLVALVCICACGCCALGNARRSGSYGVNRMSKINPRWGLLLVLSEMIYLCGLFTLFPSSFSSDRILHLCFFVKSLNQG
jgi:hypothetical protein